MHQLTVVVLTSDCTVQSTGHCPLVYAVHCVHQGFVKVARWNDINFYALKQTVEKTHRTLHKHMKAFENVLRQPARTTLTDGTSDWAENVQGKAGTPGNRAIDQQVFINACVAVEVGG